MRIKRNSRLERGREDRKVEGGEGGEGDDLVLEEVRGKGHRR